MKTGQEGQQRQPVRRLARIAWGVLCAMCCVFWCVALSPGLFISDSVSLFGQLESGGYDATFSCVYQLLLKAPRAAGFSILACAQISLLLQLGLYFGLVHAAGSYMGRSFPGPVPWLFALATLVNPVFPLLFSLHSVNTPANLLLVVFLFLVYRVLRRELVGVARLCGVLVLGALLPALRLDTAPSALLGCCAVVVVASKAKCWRSTAIQLGTYVLSSLLFLVAVPSWVGFHPRPGTYALSLIYRPLDKILASDPKLLADPHVTGPIEAVVRRPASSIVGHGEEVYWWDIDRNPPREVADRQIDVFLRLVVERFDVFLGDRATLLVELLGSWRTFFIGDHLFFADSSPFEAAFSRWELRAGQSRYRDEFRALVTHVLPDWHPGSPTYFLWNALPYFVLLLCVAMLYPLVPATAFVSALVVLRTLVLAATAPFGFYYYSTSLYLFGLLFAVPLACIERQSRAPARC